MNAGTHLIIGAAVGLTAAADQPPEVAALVALVAALSALLPDVDHPQSRINRRLVVTTVFSVVGHRGMTHSLMAVAVVALLAMAYAPPLVAVAVIVGYASHIAADMITRSGVPLLWPLKFRFKIFKLLRVRTGGRVEALIGAAVGLYICRLLINLV